jgi:hypothetical protein
MLEPQSAGPLRQTTTADRSSRPVSWRATTSAVHPSIRGYLVTDSKDMVMEVMTQISQRFDIHEAQIKQRMELCEETEDILDAGEGAGAQDWQVLDN